MGMLDKQAAFITGAGSGIGKGAALRFAQEGASVGVADTDEEAGAKVVAQIEKAGGTALFLPCDVSDPEQVRNAVDRTAEAFGGLQIVFANAGINGMWTPLEELHPAEWDKTLDTNLKGTYLTVHYAIPHLRKAGGGSIVITSSVNGNRVFSSAGATAYSVSKAGQVALMKMAALELARYNIRVNAVCPGAIHTNIGERTQHRHTDAVAIPAKMPEESLFINKGQGEPEDVADTCLYLASAMSRHVTGVEIYIDGGSSLFR